MVGKFRGWSGQVPADGLPLAIRSQSSGRMINGTPGNILFVPLINQSDAWSAVIRAGPDFLILRTQQALLDAFLPSVARNAEQILLPI